MILFPVKTITERYNVPLIERVSELYSRGYSDSDIFHVVRAEFEDLTLNAISREMINGMIKDNREFFNQRRQEMSVICQNEVQQSAAVLFKRSSKAEILMVDTYVDQLNSAMKELRSLDISETDEDGNFVNTSRIFVLIELADKLQSKVAKVAGTEVMREIEAYKMKMAIKADTESAANNPLPAYGPGSEMRSATPTKFHDA